MNCTVFSDPPEGSIVPFLQTSMESFNNPGAWLICSLFKSNPGKYPPGSNAISLQTGLSCSIMSLPLKKRRKNSMENNMWSVSLRFLEYEASDMTCIWPAWISDFITCSLRSFLVQNNESVLLTYQKHVGWVKKKKSQELKSSGSSSSSRDPQIGTICSPAGSEPQRATCCGRMCSAIPSGSFSRLCWPVSCTCRGDHDGIQQSAACGCGERRRWWREPTQVGAMGPYYLPGFIQWYILLSW